MRTANLVFAAAALAAGLASTAGADGIRVVPEHEHARARALDMQGPAETTGIESSVVLGAIALDKDFPALDGRVLRARVVTLSPGGKVAVHQHEARPGIAYVLEGEVTEHRSDTEGALVRRAGEAAFEQSGIVHWWQNESAKPVRVFVVDIVPEGTP